MRMLHRGLLSLLVLGIVAGCAAPVQTTTGSVPNGQAAPPSANTLKRITAATKNAPSFMYYKPHPGPTAGAEEIGDLLDTGLVIADDHATLRPQLAEAVPSLDNGLWRVFPDGRMETQVQLKPGVLWHDGTPFTADDLVFTFRLSSDPELLPLRHVGFDSIEEVDATSPDTVVVRWKRPYIDADALFSTRFALPLPKHLLEQAYAENKAGLMDIGYWTDKFVGTGPFKLQEFERGNHVILEANDAYVLGRPKLDEIDVRFITDDNTFVANLLAGAVDFTLGRGPSLEQALMVRDQWHGGRVEFKSLDSWLVVYPQFLDPSPSAVADPQFRRALLTAIDRQQIVQSIQAGLVPVADGNISPNNPRYAEIQAGIVRYAYDPRLAAQLLVESGYTKGPDGVFRDAANQPLSVQIRATTVLDILPKTTLAVADYWQQLGINVDTDIRSVQEARDPEWTADFPSFALQRQTGGERFLPNLRSSQARTPERGFNGLNVARYMNPEMDALIDRYVTTVPIDERTKLTSQIIHRITDDAIWLTLFFDTEPALISNRLANVSARGEDSNMSWNAEQWDLLQ